MSDRYVFPYSGEKEMEHMLKRIETVRNVVIISHKIINGHVIVRTQPKNEQEK